MPRIKIGSGRKGKSCVVWMSDYLLSDYKEALLDLDRGLWAMKNKPSDNEPFTKVSITIAEV